MTLMIWTHKRFPFFSVAVHEGGDKWRNLWWARRPTELSVPSRAWDEIVDKINQFRHRIYVTDEKIDDLRRHSVSIRETIDSLHCRLFSITKKINKLSPRNKKKLRGKKRK